MTKMKIALEGLFMKKNVIVGQSGGPTAVINASLYGVVYEALNREDSFGAVYGMINGIEGFLQGHMMDRRTGIDQDDSRILAGILPL